MSKVPERIWAEPGMPGYLDEPNVFYTVEYVRADRIDELEAKLKEASLQSISDLGQAQQAYQAQLLAEAKLAKAVEALEQIATHRKKCHEYDDDVGHERREFDVEDMIIMEYTARTTLADLSKERSDEKGQDDE